MVHRAAAEHKAALELLPVICWDRLYLSLRMYIYIYVYVYICTYVHEHMYVYTHIYTWALFPRRQVTTLIFRAQLGDRLSGPGLSVESSPISPSTSGL